MPTPAIPQSLIAQQANGEVALSWSRVVGATSYVVQRSTDDVTYATVGAPSVANYLDSTVTIGILYFYKVAAVNGSGTSAYTGAQWAIPAPTGEMSLAEIRLHSQQKADQVNSKFVSTTEWNTFINLAYTELYDMLITAYEDLFCEDPIQFLTDGTTYMYSLPTGSNTFLNASGATITPKPFYKLLGVDLAINTNTNNAYVTINKFNFIDRNKFVYPNGNSTLYGVFNLRYRLVGNKMMFTPTPTSGQTIRLWYAKLITPLLQETDISTIGYNGWLQYVIVRAAKYAMDKEESSTEKLDEELLFLKNRIESASQNRDEGQPDTISDIRSNNNWGFGGSGSNGPTGGF